MALPGYTLGTLRAALRDEFGLSDTADENDVLDQHINKAYLWIINKKNNWPWLRAELVIDATARVLSVGQIANGSKQLTILDGSHVNVKPRMIFIPNGLGGDQTQGYLVESINGNVATLRSQYRGPTSAQFDCQFQRGFFEMPADFIRLEEKLARVDKLDGEFLHWKRPADFDQIKNARLPVGAWQQYYTVKPDPLKQSSRSYLAVFPYVSEATTFIGNYWRLPDSLRESGDVPVIPDSRHDVLFHFAAWFVGVAKGKDSALIHRDAAIESLRTMMQDSDFVDEDDHGYEQVSPGFVPFPSTLDEFPGSPGTPDFE